MSPGPGDRSQAGMLTRTFLARFFENEITTGTDDLKGSFFWLLSLLATPGMLLPFVLLPGFELIARIRGVEVLRVMSRGVKAFYLGLAVVGAATVAAIVWRSLLVDRRDALVLGALPVRSRTIIIAKLLALTVYVGAVIVVMHVAASVGFGVVLASNSPLAFALRGISAHFVASSLAGLFVFALAVAVQGAALALLGPRPFRRISSALQAALVAAIVLALIALPAIGGSSLEALAWTGAGERPWLLSTPPLWFLGVYEVILGTEDALLNDLARTAVVWLTVAVGVAAVSFPLAYQRVIADAVEHPAGLERIGRAMWISRLLERAAGRDSRARCSAQFFLATLTRVEQHRFALAIAAGAALAWCVPASAGLQLEAAAPGAPSPQLLALPLAVIVIVLAGLRAAILLPADLRASWMFDLVAAPAARIRAAVRRTMFLIVVAPVVLGSFALDWRVWGLALAFQHAAICLAVGALVIEYFVRDLDAMPCARPWRVDGAHLRTWWAAYVFAFVVLAGTSAISIPTLAGWSFGHPIGYVLLIGVILLAAVWIRMSAAKRRDRLSGEPNGGDTGVVQLNLS